MAEPHITCNGDLSDDASIAQMYLRAFGRGPTEAEVVSAAAYLDARLDAHQGEREAALVDLAISIFNMKEFIYIR